MTGTSGLEHNAKTLATYEQNTDLYAARTEQPGDPALAPNWAWIDQALSLVPGQDSRILEIGSATGRDAQYIEERGYRVQRTDAALGFVALLREAGHDAVVLNALSDPIPPHQDLILANAVFPHFDRGQQGHVLQKCRAALAPQGVVAFSNKLGSGDKWVTEKLGGERYMHYWDANDLLAFTEDQGFGIEWTLTDVPGQYDHRWIFVVASAR